MGENKKILEYNFSKKTVALASNVNTKISNL